MTLKVPNVLRSRRQTSHGAHSAGWTEATPTKPKKPYGASHIKLFATVDLHTPSRMYTQKTNPSFQTTPDTSPTRVFVRGRSTPPPASPPNRDRDPRRIQWHRWTREIIPQLIPIYLALLRKSNNLRTIDRRVGTCECLPVVRKLTVKLVSLEGISDVLVCSCHPARLLLESGYLVSAPLRPTFAFDIQMLDLLRRLHLRSPPNKTAWSLTLESFLSARGYNLDGKDIIRRKMTASLKWYTYLCIEVDVSLRKVVDHGGQEVAEHDDGDENWEDEEENIRYLADCCPECFGLGTERIGDSPDVILCLDACFTQKRRTPLRGTTHDPPIRHPRSVFLTEAELAAAQDLVERARPPRATPHPPAGEDTVENGMKVPRSVLDGCLESFTAADEKRTKASTKYFSDTGLMALLCRHDRVLWLANMTTAGERQYYAIALIIKLFKFLPETMTVGIMYDVGCQLERSCLKWGFINDLLPRISWAVSVFHAYGHQWACQLVYHPRKREGFGLSDGEGCERFWSAIEFLIATLRISGYHQRLFSLDVQVAFLREQSLGNLGSWLKRKFKNCTAKRTIAMHIIGDLLHSTDELREQWKIQVESQTQPLSRATGALAKKAVQGIATLIQFSTDLGNDIATVDRKIARIGSVDQLDELVETRTALTARKTEVEEQIASRKEALGLRDKADLTRMMKDKYLELRLKALAVKERLRAKLQARKFEFERIDRAEKKVSNAEHSLHAHINTQIGRHASNITQLQKKYNGLCDDIVALIAAGKAPAGTLPPRRLPKEDLYALDVDAPIWDDTGLDNRQDGVQIPLWLGDDSVRRGIVAVLDLDRCNEELRRLRVEAMNLQEWVSDRWRSLSSAYTNTANEDIRFQLSQMITHTERMASVWREDVREVCPQAYALSWGPPDVSQSPPFGPSSPNMQPSSADEGDDSSGDESAREADDRLIQALESVNLLSNSVEDNKTGDWGVMDDFDNDLLDRGSPRKRRRQ